jgi:AraC-like DNA-binding protein
MITEEAPPIVFLATTCNPNCTYRIDKHLDGYCTMQYMQRGGIELAYDDREYTIEGSWFWPAHPGPRTRFHVAPGYADWFHRHVGFRGPLTLEWMARGLWPAGPQPAPPGRDYGEFFDEIIAQANRPGAWARLRAANLLEQLLLELAEAREQPTTGGPDSWLLTVVERLDRPSGDAPDYAGIARGAGVSVSALRRRFRKAMGVPIHRYAIRARISEARRLIAETDLPIKSISARLGYDDVFFFTRQFHKITGVTPGVLRRSRLSLP